MKIRISAFLAAMAVVGLCSLPAFAGDGEKDKPTGAAGGECKGDAKAKEGDCCKGKKDGECVEGAKKECGDDAEAVCGECAEGAKEGKECCKEKAARTDLEVVTLAAVEGTSEAAKKVLAAVPAAALEKVEAARKVALEQLARIQGAMSDLKKDFDVACAEAKAKSAEVSCDMKATYETDMKALQAKAKEQIDLCAKTIRESIGEDKIKELSADCRKAGDMAKAAGAKIKAAAAKLLEKKKAAEAEEEGEDEADDGKCVEGGKGEEKKPEKKEAK